VRTLAEAADKALRDFHRRTRRRPKAKHHQPLLTDPEGKPARFDVLRPQRLAAPVTVYVEQFSAHPLEADAAELYGPPDGYIDSAGRVHKERQSASDKDSAVRVEFLSPRARGDKNLHAG
jgi:hypothetical protein